MTINLEVIEWIVFGTSMVYVYCAAHKLIYTWPLALIYVGLTFYLDIRGNLYLEGILQLFYFLMGIYGWLNWKKDKLKNLPITRWPINYHLINIALSSLASMVLGYLFFKYTDQKNPFLDAFTTCFSLLATYMVVKRILENWIYWIFINGALICLFYLNEYPILAFQYAIFLVMSFYGLWKWTVYYKKINE